MSPLPASPATDSLDAAWAEAEAALPEGWRITIIQRSWDMDEWNVFAQTRDDWEDWGVEQRVEADGPTPTAALRALAAALRVRDVQP